MEWFRHDFNMESDDAVANLILDFRLEGLGAYIHVLHILYNNGGRAQIETTKRNLCKLSKNGEDIYKALIEEGLIVEDGEEVYSNRVDQEYIRQQELTNKRSEAGKKGMRSRWGDRDNNIVITNDNRVITNDNKPITKDNKSITNNNTIRNDTIRNIDNLSTNVSKLSSENLQIAPPEKSSTFITMILRDGDLYEVSEKDVEMYQTLYPAIDVKQKLRDMSGWCMANKPNRKSRQGIKRFIDNWLRKDNDRAVPRQTGGYLKKDVVGASMRSEDIHAEKEGDMWDDTE